MHQFFKHLLVVCIFFKIVYTCVVTSSTGTPGVSSCSACTLDATQIIMISEGTKDFTSDTIDTSGTCAIRTSVCDGFSTGSGVLITFNRDAAGQNNGTGTVTSVLICNSAGQWTKDGVVITEIECQSTP